jgi:dTDP-L-rhamnose 4-epimerase
MALSERVLVTGGAGFIGTTLARTSAPSSSQWVVYDSLLEQVHGPHPELDLASDVRVVEGDVRDVELLTRVVRELRPQVVVHLASETGTGQSLDLPRRHTDVNVTGTAALMEALDTAGVLPRRIVLTSSRAVYGEGAWRDDAGTIMYPSGRPEAMLRAGIWDYPGHTPMPSRAGTTMPAPCNVYGATKLAQEHLLLSWATARGVSLGTARLQNVYGPGQSPINPYTGITTLFYRLAWNGEPIPVYEDGSILRDFVFIDDVVRALETLTAGDESCLVDVGSGIATTIGDVAREIARHAGSPEPRVTGQYRLGDVRSASCDMDPSEWVRAAQSPTTLRDGLSRLGEWMRARAVS